MMSERYRRVLGVVENHQKRHVLEGILRDAARIGIEQYVHIGCKFEIV